MMNVLKPVSSIMTKSLKTVSPDDSLAKVGDVFSDNNIHHIPVVRLKEIVGMISKTDYIYFSHGCLGEKETKEKDNNKLIQWKAEDIMSYKLAKMDSDDPIRTALDLFRLNRFHALPILKKGKLVGILTPHDIIKTLAEEHIPLENYKSSK